MNNRKILAVGVLTMFAYACPKAVPVPPVIIPDKPRDKIEPTTLKFRMGVINFVDQTGYAGGVVQTGIPEYNLVKSGPYLLSPPGGKTGGGGGGSMLGGLFGGAPAPAAAAAPAPTATASAGGTGPQGMPYVKLDLPGLVQSVPDAMTSMLYESGRFDVEDRGQLRNLTQEQAEGRLSDLANSVDGILYGAVTSVTGREMMIDFRLMNTRWGRGGGDFQGGPVMWAFTGGVKVTNAGSEVTIDRDDLRKVVAKLVQALPDPKEMRKGLIVSREGFYVTVNMGREDRVIKGMNAFVANYNDTKLVDPKSGDTIGEEAFYGEIFVFAVYGRTSRGYIWREGGRDKGETAVRVNDYVIFK
jgi:hypothetical protein